MAVGLLWSSLHGNMLAHLHGLGCFFYWAGEWGEGGLINIGLSVVIFLLVFAMGYCLLDWSVCRSVACATSCISGVWVHALGSIIVLITVTIRSS
jgi:hypothetical protein